MLGLRGARCLASVTEISNKSGAIKVWIEQRRWSSSQALLLVVSAVYNLVLFSSAQWSNTDLQQCKPCPNVEIYTCCCSRRSTSKLVLDYYSKPKPKHNQNYIPPWYCEMDTLAECKKVSLYWIWVPKQQIQGPTSILDCRDDNRAAFCDLPSMSREGVLSTPPSSPEDPLPWAQRSLMVLDSLCTEQNPSKNSHCDRQGEGLTQYPLSLALGIRHRSDL